MNSSQSILVLLAVTIILLIGSHAEFSNYQNNVVTNGSHFFTVYPDPGPSQWPFKFFTTDPELLNWTRQSPPLFYEPYLPVWAEDGGFDNFEINIVLSNFNVYYDAEVLDQGTRAIGVLWWNQEIDKIAPWLSLQSPLLNRSTVNLVEPHFVSSSSSVGSPVLICRDSRFTLIAVQLTKDGLTAVEEPRTILEPSFDWEEGEITNPWTIFKNGHVYLMYLTRSGKVGVARSQHPLGPYEKYPQSVGTFDLRQKKEFKKLSQQQLIWGKSSWPLLPNQD